jgi:hypothetical protein
MDLVMERRAILLGNDFDPSPPPRPTSNFTLHPMWPGITIKQISNDVP